jgi:HSP20 family protein
MSVRMWNPSADLIGVSRLMDRLLDEVTQQTPERGAKDAPPTRYLPVDIVEGDQAYRLVASVPGLTADDVEVTFQDRVLTIETKAPALKLEGTWIRQERPWCAWSRQLQLPQQVDAEKITAHVENGVLTVSVPKAEQARPRRIQIGGAGQRT